MGPVWQNPIQRTVRTAHLSVLMTVHSFSTHTKRNSSDNLPSYPQTNIIAQMLSIRGKGNTGTRNLVTFEHVVYETSMWIEQTNRLTQHNNSVASPATDETSIKSDHWLGSVLCVPFSALLIVTAQWHRKDSWTINNIPHQRFCSRTGEQET